MITTAEHDDRVSHHDETISELLKNGSIELTDNPEIITEVKDVLPYSMSVYTPSLPNRSLTESLVNLKLIHEAGFNPVPHIAARRVKSSTELNEFLEQAVKEYGVHRVLLIGGDIDKPLGPYNDPLQILKEGVLNQAGVREVGLGERLR